MKNLKKVLAFVLAFTMVLGFAVSASVFPDVDDNASYAEAVTILNSLKIMVGDEKGNFNPNDTITRAEVTAVIVRMTGLEAAANGAKGATVFTDVAADHWATGYINLAYQSGIINGYGDGTFGPSDPVTHEQAIKMIVAALGYTPKAMHNGGYPSGYLVIASQKGVTTGVSGSAGEPAKRSAVARAVFNALTVEVMKQTGFVKGQEEYSEDTDETLLKDALKVDKYQGVVSDTYLSIGTDSDDDRIIIHVDYVNDENVTDYYETFVEGDVDAVSLFGQTVVAYAAEDENTGDLTILAIAPRSGKNSSVTLDYSQIDSFDENEGVIKYYAKATDTRTVKLELAEGNALECYYNGREDKNVVLDWLENPVTGSVKLIDNDNDDEYEYVLVSQFTSHAVVADIDTTTSTLEGKNGDDIDIDIEDENVITRFFAADGSAIEFEDIEVGDVISIMKSTDETLVMAYISKDVVEGTITEEKPDSNGDNGYTISGKEYRIALDGDGTPKISLSVGNEGKFFLNVEGRIVAKDARIGDNGGNYAYMYKAGVTTGVGGTEVEVRYLTIGGEWVTSKLASKVMVYKDSADGVSVSAYPTGTATTSDLGICTVTKSGNDYNVDATPQLFMYNLNSSGKINRIYVVGNNNQVDDDSIFSRDASATEANYKESLGKIGNVYFDDDTKVFSVPADVEDIVDEDDIVLTTAKALFKADNTYTVEAYDIDGTSPAVMIAYGAQAAIAEETKLFVITKITESNNENGVKVKKLYGYQMGKDVSAVEQEDGMTIIDRYEEPATVSVGDAVIFSLNAAGELDKVKVLMSVAEAMENIEDGISLYEENDELYTIDIFGFAASKPRTGQLTITGDAFDDPTTAEVESITEKLTATDTTIYEINLNRSLTASAITVSSYSKIIKGENVKPNTDAHWIYVRKFDDSVVDAVIYRYVLAD